MAEIPPEKALKKGLNIFGCDSLNPVKLVIAAEELGIPYNYIKLDMGSDLGTKWYTSINPNGKVPAIVHVKEDDTSETVFESAACLLYMASEFDKEHKISYPFGTSEYWSQMSWLSWQVAGYGPMMGQAAYFNRYATEPVPYASRRYTAECRRLHDVLDKRLASAEFVAGDRMTVADFAIFIFAHSTKWCGIDIKDYRHVKAWHGKLMQREAVQNALKVPGPYMFSDEAVSNPDDDAQAPYKMLRKYGGQWIKGAHEKWAKPVEAVPSDHANHS
ncbi:glutathione S-transferase [Nemania sp. FL0031]|nr:glutathione S-transferase [Nemania sp. FL0031]